MIVRVGLFCCTLLIFIYLCCIGIKNVFRYNKFKQKNIKLNFELNTEKQKNTMLKNKEKLLGEERVWEILAKKKLGVLKKNERVYQFIEKE